MSKRRDLGLGIGWRPELAVLIDRHPGLGFVEVMAEELDPAAPIPEPLCRLRKKGLTLIPHGISLSLGGAEPLDTTRLQSLARLAVRLDAPLVSEHIAFVRADGIEAGHLLPLPRTRIALDLLVEHVQEAQAELPVPLALENVATLFEWPNPEMDEADFLCEVLDRTNAQLLLDISNVYANSHNFGWDAIEFLERIPLDRIAYLHIAGGTVREGLYHDSHAHSVQPAVLDLLAELSARFAIPGVLLERDDQFPLHTELEAELESIRQAVLRGSSRGEKSYAH